MDAALTGMEVAHGGAIIEVIVFLLAAILAALGVQRLRWSPVVGYLIAGAVIGPSGFGLVAHGEEIRTLAEFGIVFLMFTIGLELSLERLKAMRAFVFGLGGLQVAASATAIALLGLAFGLSGPAAAVVGLALALSSTAVVMRLLMDKEAVASPVGRRALGILLFQDIAVVPILLLVGILADEVPHISVAALEAIGQAALAIVLVILAGRVLARPLFHTVATTRSPELFAATTLLVVLASAWIMEMVGLSMALGAFLAGVLLAETEYAPQVELDIEPYRGLLLGLFFISVGMAIDPAVIFAGFHWIVVILILMLAVKASVVVVLARLFRLPGGSRLRLGLLLAQAGEFAFVVFAAAQGLDLLAGDTVQILTVVVGLSVALTPALEEIGSGLEAALGARQVARGPDLAATGREMRGHVVIAGFGRVGRIVAKLLEEQRISWLALDLSPQNVAEAARHRLPVFYGNAAAPDMLRLARVDKAALLVITLDSAAAATRAVMAAKRLNPDLGIIARARDHVHGRELERHGASAAVPETLEASLQLGGQVLRAMGFAHATADEIIDRLRGGDYAALRSGEGENGNRSGT